MAGAGLRVAVVGLEFGGGFVGPFAAHPDVAAVGVCDVNPATLARVADRWGLQRRHADWRETLGREYDAVALFTPIPQHAEQVLAVLDAGQHCACAVPMATTLEDLRAIVAAQRRSGRVYMMMETSLYSAEFLFVEQLVRDGDLGRLQLLQGRFHMNLENHPAYWHGLPPMHYSTHPVSPMLALAGTRAEAVSCVGSGTMREELHVPYGNPFPVETAHLKLFDSDVAVQVTSIHYETALQMKESFDVYGNRQSFTWKTFWDDRHALIRLHPHVEGGPKHAPMTVFRMEVPGTSDRLPAPLRAFGPNVPQAHLVHEFVRSIVEQRRPRIDAVTAANWTAPGLCAHRSAMEGGRLVAVPAFDA